MRARQISCVCALFALAVLAGCESTPTATTPRESVVAGELSPGDEAQLGAGRALFVGRCARCHALPKVAEYSSAQWRGLVASMAKRSGLKPAQSQSVLRYILLTHPKKRS